MITLLLDVLRDNIRLIAGYFLAVVIVLSILAIKGGKITPAERVGGYLQKTAVAWGVKRAKQSKFTKKSGRMILDSVVESILFTFGITWLGVEFFYIILLFAALFFFLLLWLLLGDIILASSAILSGIIALTAWMYVYSLKEEETKTRMVLDFVDLCCTKMTSGVYVAIAENASLAAEPIAPFVIQFIKGIEDYHISVLVALERLDKQLGNGFHDFYSNAYDYELHSKEGMEVKFDDVKARNAAIREDMIMKDVAFDARVGQAKIISLIVLFALILVAVAPMSRDAMQSVLGKAITAGTILIFPIVLLGTRIIQYKVLPKLLKLNL